jgi:hypothetical protein
MFLTLVLSLIAIQADTLDYPHTGANNITCDSCHFIYGTEPSLLPPWTSHIPQDIDDTQYNTLCWSCHNGLDTAYVRTHSSLETTVTATGQWNAKPAITPINRSSSRHTEAQAIFIREWYRVSPRQH